MNNFKVIAFTISAILALLVLTNGNGSLLQTAFGDSDSKEDSVDEIIETAEEESNQARDEAEEADTDDEARDRESDEDEDEVDDEDNINNGSSEDNSDDNVRDEFEVDDASSNLDSEIEDEVREVKDNVEEDESDDDTPVLGEGSGMQIFVSPREIVNEILDQHLDSIEEQLNNPPPTSTPGGVGSPGDGPTVPRLGLTFDEDSNNLSLGDGNEGNHIFLLTFH